MERSESNHQDPRKLHFWPNRGRNIAHRFLSINEITLWRKRGENNDPARIFSAIFCYGNTRNDVGCNFVDGGKLFNRVRIENDDPRRRGGGSSESRKRFLAETLPDTICRKMALIWKNKRGRIIFGAFWGVVRSARIASHSIVRMNWYWEIALRRHNLIFTR